MTCTHKPIQANPSFILLFWMACECVSNTASLLVPYNCVTIDMVLQMKFQTNMEHMGDRDYNLGLMVNIM